MPLHIQSHVTSHTRRTLSQTRILCSGCAFVHSTVLTVGKNPPPEVAVAGDLGSIPGQEDPLEEEMATRS